MCDLLCVTHEEVTLQERSLEDALRTARARTDRYSGGGWYGTNALAPQLVGSLGEAAMHEWLQAGGYSPRLVAQQWGADAECDVRVGRIRIEVKTFSPVSWEYRLATVSPYQWRNIARKADAVAFMRLQRPVSLARPADAATIDFVGWLSLGDYRRRAVPYIDDRLHAQLRVVPGELRPPGALHAVLTADHRALLGSSDAMASPNEAAACGHRSPTGHCFECIARPSHAPRLVLLRSNAARRFHHVDRDVVEARHHGWPFLREVGVRTFTSMVAWYPPCGMCFSPDAPDGGQDELLAQEGLPEE